MRIILLIIACAVSALTANATVNPLSNEQVPLPKAFGSSGSVSISSTSGAVSDSIALEVAPGRRGIKPRLSISYNSMAGNGDLGLGWSIGLGSIQRWSGDGIPSVKAIVEQSANDRYSYSLGGAGGELHDENGDGVYRARIESVYRPFEKNGNGWVMYDGRGVSYHFGSTSNSRIDGELWLLNQVIDPSGNTMTYSYKTGCELVQSGQYCDSESQKKYISTIHYTGYGANLGENLVEFTYEQRPDQKVSYTRGVREAANLRLNRVSNYAQTDLVRRYQLAYDQFESGPSRLTSVTLIGADDTSEVVLRSVDYSERPLGWQASVNTTLPVDLAEEDGKGTGVQLMDVNGDGYADLVNNATEVYLGSGFGGFSYDSSWTGSLADANVEIVNDSGIDTGVRLLDVNGDARPDIFIATPDRTEIRLNTGAGWEYDDTWTTQLASLSVLEIALTDGSATTNCRAPACSSFSGNPPAGCSGEYCTGDPEIDAEDCVALEEEETELPFCVAPIFTDPGTESFSLIGADGESKGVELADVNADGKIDIVWSLMFDQTTFLLELPRIVRAVFLNGGSDNPGWYKSDSLSNALGDVLSNQDGAAGAFIVENKYQGYSLMDVNGDGLADIVRSIDGKQAVYLSNGSGWVFADDFTQSMISQGIFTLDADLKSQGLMPMDFNGDGLLDYVRADDGYYEAYVNTGYGWLSYPAMVSVFESADVDFVDGEGKGTGVTMADINGDGAIDLVSSKAGQQGRFLFGYGVQSNKFLQSVNTLGEITEVGWSVSTEFDNTAPNGIQTLPITLSLANKLTRYDGLGGELVTDYVYSGGLYTDEGLRGFGTVYQIPSAGLETVTKYYQDEYRSGQPFEIRAYDSLHNLRALTTSVTDVIDALTIDGSGTETGVTQVLLMRTDTQRIDADGTVNQSFVLREYNDRLQAVRVYNDDEVGVAGEEKSNRFSWARNDNAGIWDLLVRAAEYDSEETLLSETITLYDNLEQGNASRGLPTATREMVEPGSYVTRSLNYDNYGNVTSVVNRTGNTTAFFYDTVTSTFRVEATDPLGRITRSQYDHRFGTLTRDADASGNATTTAYDAFGRKTKVVSPGDEASPFGTVSYEYSGLGDPQQQYYIVKRTENAGSSDVFEEVTYFDAFGRIYETRKEAAAGDPIVTLIGFGEDGQPAVVTLPFFEGDSYVTIMTERDDLGRITATTDPLGQTVRMSYSGLKLNIEDARGNTTTVISNANGDPQSFSMEVSGELQNTQYTYDPLGRLTNLVDALGSETRITYDSLSRRTKLEDPNAGTFQYAYDGEGRLIKQTGPDGKDTQLHYSPAGELIKKQLPDGTAYTFRYGTGAEPNDAGKLVEVQDGAGKLKLGYDKRGRVIERKRTVDGRTYVTGYVYDSMNRTRQVIYPDGFSANYDYDAGNNLAAITDKKGRPIAEGFQYTASERIAEFTFGNGVTTSYSYDDLARMASTDTVTANGVNLQKLAYVFDSANNVLELDDLATGMTQSFEYDEANHLTRAMGPYGEETYEYDAVGNLLKKGNLYFGLDPAHPQRVACGVEVNGKSGGKKSRSATQSNCVQNIAGVDPNLAKRAFEIAYDARGNVISKGAQQYEYNSENQLVRAYGENGKLTEINVYDAAGGLIVKQHRNDKTVYIDGIYEEGKTHVSRHIRAGSMLVATLVIPRANVELITDAHPSNNHVVLSAGLFGGAPMLLLWLNSVFGWRIRSRFASLVAMFRKHPVTMTMIVFFVISGLPQPLQAGPLKNSDSEKRYYYHANHLGSINVITDDDGEVTSRRDYRPYGEPFEWSGANAGPRELLQTYQGQQFDDQTGLYNFKARYYDSEIGRFLSADTVVADSSDPRTLNRYAFAGGNPIQFVDPSGNSFWSSVGDFFGSVGDAINSAVDWVGEHAIEILTVVVIVIVVVVVVVAIVATGGLAAGGLLAYAAAGAAIGFATFGGIALSQGNDITTGAFWQAAGTGAVLGGLVGAALPVAFGAISLGPVAAGALVGAAAGGLEQAVACATGCGGVENLFLPVAQGVVVGGILGAIGGKVAGKFLGSLGSGGNAKVSLGRQALRFLVEPGKIGFVGKAAYAGSSHAASSAGASGFTGRRTLYGDLGRLVFFQSASGADESSAFYGALDDAGTGLCTAPTQCP